MESGISGRRAVPKRARAGGPGPAAHLRFVDVLQPEDFDSAFTALRRIPADGLIVMADQLTQTRGADIVRLVTDRRLAAVFGGPDKHLVKAGGLISLSADSATYWRQAASHADGILKGASPADLPVEQPTPGRSA